ncbi:TetR/AcrR family transcriptional regulator [Endozoicomonas sp. 4G]|uniref:TetR/AcrR family transcriptional regulator n=1 Tax=Endozoicomonas sp. 4G TaxID=2872754 RepID=UPI0020784B59|nr:TetR/AcrR family transcriptional regulator [Endozoicomonas sp. 4G]
MGRHTSFNKDKALDNALALFWSRGFSASSLRQLEEATDLHPGSLYYHFKNKEGLYLQVLQYYIDHYLQLRIDKHLSSGPPLEGLRRFLTAGYRHSRDRQYQNCCFLACTSTELHLLPDQAAELVRQAVDRIQQALLAQILNSAEKNLIAPGLSSTDAARELTSFFLGLQLMARINPNQHQLDLLVKRSLGHILNPKT